jgi:hypothetical protein
MPLYTREGECVYLILRVYLRTVLTPMPLSLTHLALLNPKAS